MNGLSELVLNVTGSTHPLRILTHNIRYATSSPFENERPWSERKPLILSELSYQTRFLDGGLRQGGSFICLQEVLHVQLCDILASLNDRSGRNGLAEGPKWAHIGVGRENGKKKGEYSPILYPIQVYKLLHFEYKWLSPTPNTPSKGWDAGSERIFTVGVFEHRQTGQRLVASNTHLDNVGSIAREKSVAIILDTLEEVRRNWKATDETLQYFVAGDFNSFPTQEAYRAMESSGEATDAYDCVPKLQHFGDENTFTGFEPDTDKNKKDIGRIDFVWLGPKDTVTNSSASTGIPSWDVQGYSVTPNVFDKGIYSSDHRAVVVDALLSF
ncbi:hypothetical protein MMC10_010428 [Thelotrema lepadinum]|nr:hypothetical protein [Thelotrema lepadinum]